jgi:LmbE family N-acetylglucosaminyl deacetylase
MQQGQRILVAVAHADDETLGCFSHLLAAAKEAGRGDLLILHGTNSTPADLRYALKNGYPNNEEYRAARKQEMLEALATIGLDPDRHWRQLDIADQDSPKRIATIRETVASYQPDRIYTHAYEGGHPDHDAIAYALHGLPNVWEFPLYHASADGTLVVNRFISGEAAVNVTLSAAEVELKERMLGCFRSQKRVIANFPIQYEHFRPMRQYDFEAPPHYGRLYYEIRQHGWTWPLWHQAVTAESPGRPEYP